MANGIAEAYGLRELHDGQHKPEAMTRGGRSTRNAGTEGWQRSVNLSWDGTEMGESVRQLVVYAMLFSFSAFDGFQPRNHLPGTVCM